MQDRGALLISKLGQAARASDPGRKVTVPKGVFFGEYLPGHVSE